MARNSNPKNESCGVFTSSSAVRSQPSHDLQRLYYRTTASDRHDMSDVSQSDRAESLGQIHYIGKKSTKYMPYRYQQAPLQNKHDCWYANDYCEKDSDWAENKLLQSWFRGPAPQYKAPLIEKTSHHRQSFQQPSKDEHNRANQPNKSPEWTGRKTIGSDLTLESRSFTHSMHMAPMRRIASQEYRYKDNLEVTGLDSGDCYRTTYRNDFFGKQRPLRCNTAPSSLREQTLLDATTRRDPEIARTTRNGFSKPGR